MKFRLIAAVAAAALVQVGCAHAQSGPPQATPSAGGFVVRRPPAPWYTGLAWSGTPQVQPDGTVRSADYPVITEVLEGSPAAKAGVQVGDRVLLVNGKDGREPGALRAHALNETFVLRIRRGDALRDITFVTAPNPAAARQTP